MTEEKPKPKEKEKITTIQEGIFRCERDLMELNDPRDYNTSIADQIRRELSVLEDGHAETFEDDLVEAMADEENIEDWSEKYNTFGAMALTAGFSLEEIEKVVERPAQQRKSSRLIVLEAKLSRTKEVRKVKPVMRERGKQKFEAKYGKVGQDGKIKRDA